MSPEPALRDPPASDLALPAARLMERETRRRFAPVAAVLDGIAVEPGHSLLRGDAFVLNAGRDIVFHYRRGEGVTVSAPPQAEAGEVELWFNGSVYAAIASLNGLLPFHASAIAHEGRVHAFSAPPGGGKSTLTAALGREGFALFCDDTLILDISDPDRIMCLPGHKRLKLWPDALDLTGATGEEQVSAGYPKVFASPSAGAVSQALPLAEMVFLERADSCRLDPLPPAERIARLQDDHYTAMLFEQAGGLSRRERFLQLAGVAGRMPMASFSRPFEPTRFKEGVRFIAAHIGQQDRS